MFSDIKQNLSRISDFYNTASRKKKPFYEQNLSKPIAFACKTKEEVDMHQLNHPGPYFTHPFNFYVSSQSVAANEYENVSLS